jgi:phosphonate transport system substrate-binding protein
MHLHPLAAFVATAILAAPAAAQKNDPKPLNLSFGIYQSDKATVMYSKFAPVIDRIQSDAEKRLARPVDIDIEIFRTYDDGIDALAKGTVDFVRFGPASYITAQERNPRIRLLAMELEDGKKTFPGMIVVQRASPIQKLADLRGRSFAFGDPNSTIGRYLVQAELVKAGIYSTDLSRFGYLDRHDKVARAVQVGDYDAGSIKESNYDEMKDSLRVLLQFDNVTKPWVAREGLDLTVQNALQASLLELKDPAAMKELKVSGFAPATDEDYRPVREGMKQAAAFDKGRSGN